MFARSRCRLSQRPRCFGRDRRFEGPAKGIPAGSRLQALDADPPGRGSRQSQAPRPGAFRSTTSDPSAHRATRTRVPAAARVRHPTQVLVGPGSADGFAPRRSLIATGVVVSRPAQARRGRSLTFVLTVAGYPSPSRPRCDSPDPAARVSPPAPLLTVAVTPGSPVGVTRSPPSPGGTGTASSDSSDVSPNDHCSADTASPPSAGCQTISPASFSTHSPSAHS